MLPCLPQLCCQHRSRCACPQDWSLQAKGPRGQGHFPPLHHLLALCPGDWHKPCARHAKHGLCQSPRCHPIFNMFLRNWEAAEQRTAAVLLCPQTPGFNSTQCHPWSRSSTVTVITAQIRSDKAASEGKGKYLKRTCVPDFSQNTR